MRSPIQHLAEHGRQREQIGAMIEGSPATCSAPG